MLKYIFKAMRPRQWTKNAFVLAALVFDRQLFQIPSLERTILTFVIFCLVSSSVYLINDVMDIDSDRLHPVKKNRPIASGKVPVKLAVILSIILITGSLIGAYFLSIGLLVIASVYFVLNLAYSKWLKHIPIIDVLVIAACFVLRVAAGVSVIEVERFSPWLYVVTTLFALYIGFGKRRAELMVLVPENGQSHRKVLSGYSIEFLDQLITIVSSTTIIAYSLYTFSAPNLPDNHAMMLTIPFVLYGVFRYLSIMHLNKMGGEPEELLLKDRPLQVTIFLWAISIMIIFYIF
ncbi:MAG: decaprenyl-phosphate phosphoribosyltransferase [Chloroflexi bacterium HGW-Chloroflexi-4]|jgi:4-hydroxybenzoate polyprenyltransferase|nr:MAG: decaprenyl-phosphate phosphoribosyltransferase [Chloroflexi bacterium HGW-Chloroflexi-4]